MPEADILNQNGNAPPLPRTAADVQTMSNSFDMNVVPADEPVDPLDALLEPLAGEPPVTPVEPAPVAPAPVTPVTTPAAPAATAAPMDIQDVLASARANLSDDQYQKLKGQLNSLQRQANAFELMTAAMDHNQPQQQVQAQAPRPPSPPQIDREAIDKAFANGMPVGEIIHRIAEATSQYHAQLAQYNLKNEVASMVQNQIGEVSGQLNAFKQDLQLEKFTTANPEVTTNPLVRRAMIGQIQEMAASGQIGQNTSPGEVLTKAYAGVKEELQKMGIGAKPAAAPAPVNPAQNLRAMAANSVAAGGQRPVTAAPKPATTMLDAVNQAVAFLSNRN